MVGFFLCPGKKRRETHEQVWKKSGRPAFDGRPVRRPAGRLRRRAGGRRHPDGPVGERLRLRSPGGDPPPGGGHRLGRPKSLSAPVPRPRHGQDAPGVRQPAGEGRDRRRALAGGALVHGRQRLHLHPLCRRPIPGRRAPHHRRRGLHPGLLSGAPPGVQLPGGGGRLSGGPLYGGG